MYFLKSILFGTVSLYNILEALGVISYIVEVERLALETLCHPLSLASC